MKRLLLILSLLIMAFAPVSCFYVDEAETVDPGDEAFTNPAVPVGGVTTLTATVSGLSEDNPYIIITFSSPVNSASVLYDTTVHVEYPLGNSLTNGGGYTGITNTSNIILDLGASTPASLQQVRLVLTTGINADANNSIALTPVDINITVD